MYPLPFRSGVRGVELEFYEPLVGGGNDALTDTSLPCHDSGNPPVDVPGLVPAHVNGCDVLDRSRFGGHMD